ncbi:AAA family ATPase [Nocardioides sp. CFH 31398]|uniref:AAA family ATPase n=1 Tax=Nocardioides sp. CFH 31398 TaxID=2919579 RepID=UPI001F053001|nr:AAA family ATPase [Nocardioides sp. CFH 31398]MCH1868033.1 AAA family ATPase [Nocardioides sp. CFH 31398]
MGDLLLITGPPAVGKMTVGRAVAARSDYRLFHNHHTIEPLLEVFGHGTRAFTVLNDEFRRRVLQEAAADGLRLVFSFAWWVDDRDDVEVVESYLAPYVDAGLPVRFVELYADLPTRLARNVGADRLAAKPSKADLAWSDAHVRELAAQKRMNTDPDRPSPAGDLLRRHPHLRVDTGGRTADDVAGEVLHWVGA